MYSIETKSLSKSFGDVKAVDDISFYVESGEIFGFLGPNGAGKSTTMMILTTLLKPTSGHALVSGFDVRRNPKQVREKIGYVQQETTVDEYLTGRENLLLQARLNHIPKDQIDSRIDEVLELIELSDKQNEPVVTYSGGMRKRLDIAGGLLHRPKVLFLDEPTVGLDIQTRRKIWEYIKKIHEEFEMTIFLTTHYMEEADQLCDRIGIIDGGKIQIIDSPQNMKSAMGNEVISLSIENTESEKLFLSELEKIELINKINQDQNKIILFASKGTEVIPKIFQISSDLKIKIISISLTQPTLDDVFISYTGHEIREEEGGFNRRREHAKMKRLRA
ncbi:MAG: ATP-binding cassette domain-containing protein [Nitrosopumilaceae archaeon]|uniref:ATP-binding cassette domain-containing protein n=3 Tax=Candidatus Nitrosomaritimum aestuariumsis TaxID=3342354 RepID=A0AC60W216_9ARCH|nr:ATP-binding cassette domain-containing protein [Nitrosopumilaceae archaeon]MBA4453659.1 ATP-binding cassette domain-containing protein [Nitrosopumilaceae archaeon]MBA4461586.1 ATP-binding cassette domain-containing protein [Nitrosopumilaceae archaeon]MBA4463136.1 ATP-binding cassette domain-containing protein [Nitrosopumilaceae archaeon]NCF21535.1 ATP-binding cassette domain-containing protein [Nitrosopumilaceae archaeon]